jgi:threonine/homoserine/homoserine lactone efflux protein
VGGTHDLWLFAATVLVVNATPGVDLMLTLTRTLQHGVRGGLPTALGIGAGCVLHTLAAAFGLAALMAASATAFSVVKWAGAAYLLWLAFGMLRAGARGRSTGETAAERFAVAHHRASPGAHSGHAGAATSRAMLFRHGLLTNALNPKVALFFLALLPQFIDADAPHKTLSFLALGAWFVLQGTAFMVAFVLLVAPLARWHAPVAVGRALQTAGGAIFVALAARLALAQRP